MSMSDFTKVQTTHEVWLAIHAAHELQVFSSFSDPTGTFAGGPGEVGGMETGYGLRGTDFPLLWARTTWRIGPNDERSEEKHEYWLCIGKEAEQ
jgi:hypothetical protein